MKNSTPISLFSFQDIITSLTGIMIVVVLIISLQLVESTRAIAAIAEMRPEYDMLKKTYMQLLEKRKNLEKRIVANAEAADKYEKYSVDEIEKIIKEEETYFNVIQEKISAAEKKLSDLVSLNARRNVHYEQLKKELSSLSKYENEIRELQAQLLGLQKMQQNVKTHIQRKSKMLRFEFVGLDDKIPLLIECNYWGFRCKRYPDGDVETIGTPGRGSLPKHLSSLKKWLNEMGPDASYPVLLFRSDSLVHFREIIMLLWDVYDKKCWGQELVGTNEEVF